MKKFKENLKLPAPALSVSNLDTNNVLIFCNLAFVRYQKHSFMLIIEK